MATPAPRLARANSLIRGSGHSFSGLKPQRSSIMGQGRRARAGPSLAGSRSSLAGASAVVYDLILLSNVSEDQVCKNLTAMYLNDMIYV